MTTASSNHPSTDYSGSTVNFVYDMATLNLGQFYSSINDVGGRNTYFDNGLSPSSTGPLAVNLVGVTVPQIVTVKTRSDVLDVYLPANDGLPFVYYVAVNGSSYYGVSIHEFGAVPNMGADEAIQSIHLARAVDNPFNDNRSSFTIFDNSTTEVNLTAEDDVDVGGLRLYKRVNGSQLEVVDNFDCIGVQTVCSHIFQLTLDELFFVQANDSVNQVSDLEPVATPKPAAVIPSSSTSSSSSPSSSQAADLEEAVEAAVEDHQSLMTCSRRFRMIQQ